jgi:NifU-like protein involved in Fe-S cluster formation
VPALHASLAAGDVAALFSAVHGDREPRRIGGAAGPAAAGVFLAPSRLGNKRPSLFPPGAHAAIAMTSVSLLIDESMAVMQRSIYIRAMTDLYPTAILALAADIPHLGPLPPGEGRSGRARKRSMVCGSEVEVAVRLDAEGRVAALGLDVSACALGQASASILGKHAIGASLEEVEHARDSLEAMLKDGAPAPSGRFAELGTLAPVRDYPRRHASTVLAWKAAAEAIENALGS